MGYRDPLGSYRTGPPPPLDFFSFVPGLVLALAIALAAIFLFTLAFAGILLYPYLF